MRFTKLFLFTAIGAGVLLYACKDKSDDPDPNNNDKCASKTIGVSADIVGSVKCSSTGKLTIRATGSTGFSFQIGNGAFQSDSVFNNLTAGTYTITVKDVDGCTKASSYTIAETGTEGPNFTAVKALIAQRCNQACHTSGAGGAPKGIFSTDCGIVSRSTAIKEQAVDGSMGSLNSTEKATITAWLNAGAGYTN